jgi:hypothetical protein
MKKQEIFVVIPTIRTLDFLKSWKDEFRDCTGIIVEDHKTKEIPTPKGVFKKVHHYSWKDIDTDLGKNSWIIPRKAAAIRSYGFLKSHQLGADVIVTLDDDCYPYEEGFIQKHVKNLSEIVPDHWFPTNPFPGYWFTRGFPYDPTVRKGRRVVVSHGIWVNNLDYDAPTHLLHLGESFNHNLRFGYPIPSGYYFPWCIMNVAFLREITPLTYLLLMGHDRKGKSWGFERFDDIWAGIFMKKILDYLGLAVLTGSPIVEHKRASNPFKNLQMESKGIAFNEELWKTVDRVELTQKDTISIYQELLSKVVFPKERYFRDVKKAIITWLSCFR